MRKMKKRHHHHRLPNALKHLRTSKRQHAHVLHQLRVRMEWCHRLRTFGAVLNRAGLGSCRRLAWLPRATSSQRIELPMHTKRRFKIVIVRHD